MKRYRKGGHYWRVVWRFVAGLTKFKYFEETSLLGAGVYEGEDTAWVSTLFMECLFEAQIQIDCKSTFGTQNLRYMLSIQYLHWSIMHYAIVFIMGSREPPGTSICPLLFMTFPVMPGS